MRRTGFRQVDVLNGHSMVTKQGYSVITAQFTLSAINKHVRLAYQVRKGFGG